MKKNIRENFFVLAKMATLILGIIYQMMAVDEELLQKATHSLYLAVFLVAAVWIELTGDKKIKYAVLCVEGILAFMGVFLFPVSGMIHIVFFTADFCSVLSLPVYAYLSEYLLVLPVAFQISPRIEMWGGLVTAVVICYIQEKYTLRLYRRLLDEGEETQLELKTDIVKQSADYERQLRRSHLQFENQVLEQKNQIAQALHDKLGHSINGSLYQLEAAKLLVTKRPEDCEAILQAVIDQLRLSMDEIRAILRSERPDKKRMAMLSLQALCEECETRYQIAVHLNLSDPEEKIPEKLWEIILDNTYEAVTNALKYAACHNIYIDILAMNEIVRCTIRDDGRGAVHVGEGMGIQGMKNRVRSARGQMTIESEAGFAINMILPIREISAGLAAGVYEEGKQ